MDDATVGSARVAVPRGGVRRELTSFVGRRQAVARLSAELHTSRLVTVIGPGGVGKTRTALAVANAVRGDFPDGVRVVELANITIDTQVAPVVATAVEVTDQSNRNAVDRVIDHLADARVLLVLDNCEHLLDVTAGLVLRLLEALPRLRVLATSREPLGVRGEQVHLLAPLAIPDEADAAGGGALEHVAAVQLLLDRARTVLPDFAVTDENRQAVIDLCRQLDGLPLAIELAAGRLRSMSVSQVVDRLHRRFSLLSADRRARESRHRSLRALIDWSHELCGPDERLLWARLAVFPASIDLETVERVCGFGDLDGDRLLDALDGLVGKSVLAAERDGEHLRYAQLVTLREYGAELLATSGEADLMHRRHLDHFTRRAATIAARWCGPQQAADLARLREDHPNLLAALAWSADTPGEAAAGARLAALLRYHWIAGGFLTYGRRWLERLIPQLGPEQSERGEALWAAAWVALIQGDRDVARSYLQECTQIAHALENRAMQGHAAHWHALLNLFEGDLSAAIGLYERSIVIHRSVGDVASELTAAFQLAMAQVYVGRPKEALQTCSDVIERATAHGELWNRGYGHWVSAIAHLHLDDLPRAREAAIATMTIERDFRDGVCTALSVEVSSWVTAADGQTMEAAALAAVAAAVWRRIGTSLQAFGPHASADGDRHAKQVLDALGVERTSAMRAQYAHTDVAEAVRLGLTLMSGRTTSTRPPYRPSHPAAVELSRLTSREREIAKLIAQGKSNREIAGGLTISPRTVDGHVERILRKLDFTSRSQVASWVASSLSSSDRSPAT